MTLIVRYSCANLLLITISIFFYFICTLYQGLVSWLNCLHLIVLSLCWPHQDLIRTSTSHDFHNVNKQATPRNANKKVSMTDFFPIAKESFVSYRKLLLSLALDKRPTRTRLSGGASSLALHRPLQCRNWALRNSDWLSLLLTLRLRLPDCPVESAETTFIHRVAMSWSPSAQLLLIFLQC